MKHSNLYLYDTEEVPELPKEIIDERINLLKKHLAVLLDHSYHTRDNYKVASVLKAISFWEDISSADV